MQLKTPSAAAAVRSTLQPIATTTGSGGDDEDGIATSTRYIRTSRITPQAAAASAAVLSEGQAVAAAAGVSDVQVTHRYSYALSGFAVENPSPAQLQALAADPSVLSVVEDRRVSLATYTTPQFLKLTGSGARRSSATTFTPQHHGGGGSGSGGGSWGLWDQVRPDEVSNLCGLQLSKVVFCLDWLVLCCVRLARNTSSMAQRSRFAAITQLTAFVPLYAAPDMT